MKDDIKQDEFSISIVKNIIAGGTARAVAASALHPIDLAKTRMQFQRKHQAKVYYRNGAHAIWHTLIHEGPLSLYRGLFVRLLYVVPSAAINFTVYEQTKNAFVSGTAWYVPVLAAMTGITTRCLQTMIRTPFDVVKQSLQVQGMDSSGKKQSNVQMGNARKVMKEIMQQQRIKGFWSGLATTIARDLSFAICYFGSYEALKWTERKMLPNLDSSLRFVKFGVAGAGAGAIGTVCTIPIDVLKTRLQTQTQVKDSSMKYTGAVDCLKSILRNEGWRALWRGCGPRLVQTMPAAAITFTTYEYVKSLLVHLDTPQSVEME